MLRTPVIKEYDADEILNNYYFKGKATPGYLSLIEELEFVKKNTKILEEGIIESPNVNLEHDIIGVVDNSPEILGNGFASAFNSFGVCDSYTQILEEFPELKTSDKLYCVVLTSVNKKDQSPKYGWRWHKWGRYIGKQDPQCEYIYDEPKIELVYVFQIIEIE